ncbi:MAG: hypothetical protein ACJA1W_002809, partial [Akkermansiaceae bacterium]
MVSKILKGLMELAAPSAAYLLVAETVGCANSSASTKTNVTVPIAPVFVGG